MDASLAYTVDMVCKDQSTNDLDTSQIIRYVADAMAMLGHINTDLSLLRRELMRPTLHADYRNLCNPDHPVTSRAVARTLIGGGGVYSYIQVLPD